MRTGRHGSTLQKCDPRRAVVRIEGLGRIRGAGFFVTPTNIVVTADHVVRDTIEGGRPILGRLFGATPESDADPYSGKAVVLTPLAFPDKEAEYLRAIDVALLYARGIKAPDDLALTSLIKQGSMLAPAHASAFDLEMCLCYGFPQRGKTILRRGAWGVGRCKYHDDTTAVEVLREILDADIPRHKRILESLALMQKPLRSHAKERGKKGQKPFTSLQIQPGFSGSPVIDAATYQVIGIVSNSVLIPADEPGWAKSPGGTTWFTPFTPIISLLESRGLLRPQAGPVALDIFERLSNHYNMLPYWRALDASAVSLAQVVSPIEIRRVQPRRQAHPSAADIKNETCIIRNDGSLLPEPSRPNMNGSYSDHLPRTVVLVGEAGSGKSTLLASFALQAIGDWRPGRLPVRMPLIIKAGSLVGCTNCEPAIIELMRQLAPSHRALFDGSFVTRWAQIFNVPWLILIDGLDEIDETAWIDFSRHGLPHLLRRFDNAFGDMGLALPQTVITSRPFPELSSIGKDDIPYFEILRVSEPDAVIQGWMEALGGDASSVKKDVLLSHLHQMGDAEIMNNPLLLTLSCILYAKGLGVQHTRVSLFSSFVSLMLSKACGSRSRCARHMHQVAGHISPKTLQSILIAALRKFAFASDAAKEDVFDLFMQAMGEALNGYATGPREPTPKWCRSLLKAIERETGLLIESGGGIRFAHSSFREFFAAEHMRCSWRQLSHQRIREVVENSRDERWRNALICYMSTHAALTRQSPSWAGNRAAIEREFLLRVKRAQSARPLKEHDEELLFFIGSAYAQGVEWSGDLLLKIVTLLLLLLRKDIIISVCVRLFSVRRYNPDEMLTVMLRRMLKDRVRVSRVKAAVRTGLLSGNTHQTQIKHIIKLAFIAFAADDWLGLLGGGNAGRERLKEIFREMAGYEEGREALREAKASGKLNRGIIRLIRDVEAHSNGVKREQTPLRDSLMTEQAALICANLAQYHEGNARGLFLNWIAENIDPRTLVALARKAHVRSLDHAVDAPGRTNHSLSTGSREKKS